MSDLINRQDAIDALCYNITVTGRQNAELVAAMIRTFADRIKALPSAEPDTARIAVGQSKGGVTMWYECESCHEPVDEKDAFCRGCGRRFVHE